jgi:hypothetical protein
MFEGMRKNISNLFFKTVKIEVPDSIEATSRDPAQTAVKRVGYAFVKSSGGSNARQNFEAPSFDLEQIELAYNTEAYVKQAIDKYLDLVFKAGWQLKGKNEKAIEYVKMRLEVMAEATDTPTDAMLKEIADNLIKYANVFLIKARLKQTLSVPGLNVQGTAGMQPIGGYFCLSPKTIKIARDANGTVLQYQQKVPGQQKEFNIKPVDMVHIHWKKPTGQAFGMPFLLPVLDDIRCLREIEDNVANLLYKYLHPLYKFIVGLQEPGKEATSEEIDLVRGMIAEMPMDGTLVLPERYNVEVVGAEGSAIDASWALKYFEQRVFTGLGVPETVFGRAATANKSTAENLTVEMHDRVNAFQALLEQEINFRIIKELLLEGGFDVVLKPEDRVDFIFNEIAIDEKIKLENHVVTKFTQNAITFEEMRHEIGADPVVDEGRLYFNMITIPIGDAAAKAKADNAVVQNKNTPTNQHGTKTSPKKAASSNPPAVNESFKSLKTKQYLSQLVENFRSLKHDVLASIQNEKTDQIDLYINLVSERMKAQSQKCISTSFDTGIQDCKRDCDVTRTASISSSTIQSLYSIANSNIDRVLKSVKSHIEDILGGSSPDKVALVSSVFDVNEYRLNLMAEYHSRMAYNVSYALSAASYERYELEAIEKDSACDICHDKSAKTIKLSKGQSLTTLMTKLPPWHHGCDCYVRVKR